MSKTGMRHVSSAVNDRLPAWFPEMERQIDQLVYEVRKAIPHANMEDVRQEAFALALPAAKSYDCNSPQARGYFYMVARRGLYPKVNKMLACVTISKQMSRAGNYGTALVAGEHGLLEAIEADSSGPAAKKGGGIKGLHVAETAMLMTRFPAPDRALEEKRQAHRLDCARVRLRRVLMKKTAHLPEIWRDLGDLILESGTGNPASVRRAAKQLGMDAEEAKRAGKAFRRAIAGALEVEAARQEVLLLGMPDA